MTGWDCFKPGPTNSGPLVDPNKEEVSFNLCPQAARQLWYVSQNATTSELVVSQQFEQNSDSEFKFSNQPNNTMEEGYYTFWKCGVFAENNTVKLPPKAHSHRTISSSKTSSSSQTIVTPEPFQEIIAYEQDTIQDYTKVLKQKLEQKGEIAELKLDDIVKIVGEFVSSVLGGKGAEYSIGEQWEWHSRLLQRRKEWIILDISELKYGTSFHRGTLFVILWHTLGLKGTLNLQKPEEKFQQQPYPTAKLMVQSQNQDQNGIQQTQNFEVDLMKNPGKMVELSNLQIRVDVPFNPQEQDLQQNKSPFSRFKNVVNDVVSAQRVISAGLQSNNSGRSSEPDLDIGEVGMIKGRKRILPSLSTQVYKLQKLKESDIQLVEDKGMGGFGKVMKAKFFGAEVAIKYLKKTANRSSEEAIREKLKHELFMLGWLQHPYIVNLIGVLVPQDESTNNYGIVMEYTEQGSLYQILHDGYEELSLKKGLQIVLNACAAMCLLHSIEVEHGDIATHNILVDAAYTGKLSDFGLSKTREQIEQQDRSLKFSHKNVAYKAYEVLYTDQHTTIDGEAADAYSMGVVLYEVATRRIPWSDCTPDKICMDVGVNKQKLPLTQQLLPNCKLRKLISQCWEIDPIKRPKFDQIYAQLQEIIDNLYVC